MLQAHRQQKQTPFQSRWFCKFAFYNISSLPTIKNNHSCPREHLMGPEMEYNHTAVSRGWAMCLMLWLRKQAQTPGVGTPIVYWDLEVPWIWQGPGPDARRRNWIGDCIILPWEAMDFSGHCPRLWLYTWVFTLVGEKQKMSWREHLDHVRQYHIWQDT